MTKKQGSSGYPAARPLFDHDGDLHGARLHILLTRTQVKRMVATQLDAGICVPRGRAGVRRLVRDYMMHKVLDALDPDPRAKWEPTEQALDLSEACLVICGSPAP